jgi:hypothetical protein
MSISQQVIQSLSKRKKKYSILFFLHFLLRVFKQLFSQAKPSFQITTVQKTVIFCGNWLKVCLEHTTKLGVIQKIHVK